MRPLRARETLARMNRTHAFFALAAALTLTTLIEPGARAWRRHATPQPTLASHVGDDTGVLHLSAAASHSRPLEGHSYFARYDIEAGRPLESSNAAPVEIVLVLDRSGSMAGPKLQRAKDAALSLVDQLGDRDKLAVVGFSNDVVSMDLTVTDTAGKQKLRGFIMSIWDAGSTNISGALNEAQAILGRAQDSRSIRRVVLVSDGQPTDGITSEAGLVQLVSTMHERQMAVSALGVGTDYNGTLMQHLAEHGGGFYAYLNDASRLTEVLAAELVQARGASARRAVLELRLPNPLDLIQVAGRDIVRRGDRVEISLPDFAPGQKAQVFVELNAPVGEGWGQVDAKLSYVDVEHSRPVTSTQVRLAVELTADADVAEASKDEEVAVDCLRAVGSTQMVAAAAAFERGDRTSAFAFMDRARGIFAMSADSLAGEISDTAVTQERWKNTNDPTAVRDEVLNLNRKNMSNFGMSNSY
jgi:Ca-activated chloride channel family protein